ncbi:hypothetical protein CK203_060474 [Vitis vinifera]|uniref:Uncharacterized protein n=1 Tax=Vitis vinifera TaxID=29760 RepID=A0A438CU95_VITVI|nr:hypothetical protein CK203_114877 [Vitis vinifera]RVW72443.1 hypothetical protein CK203_060474 [Vitis vinifera]
MISNRAKHDIDWKGLENTPTLAQETMDPEISTPSIPISSSTPVPCRSWRVVILLDRFMYLGEFFKAIIEEHEIDPIDYEKAMSNDNVILWQ